MAGEPGELVLTLKSQLIDRIKSTRPVRSDGKSLTTGFVYSQLVLGMPINPRDFLNPWSPMGGSTLQTAVAAAAPAAAAPVPAGAGPAPAGAAPAGATPHPAPDPAVRMALEAAFKTAQLVDNMIMVTKDDSYLEYPTTRHISFAYEGVIKGMQPAPVPPIAPDVQKQIDDARKVLYQMDGDGNIVGKTPLYRNYQQNATAYARAKADYANAQAKTLADPLTADTWPMISVTFQDAVDQAFDTLKTEGAERVERALDTIESVGVSLQAEMVARARKTFDAWNLGLAGVPVQIPYSYVLPSSWCDPNDDQSGWQGLHISQGDYHSFSQSHTGSTSSSSSDSSSSSSGGSVGINLGFFGVSGGGSYDTSDSSWNSQFHFDHEHSFANDARNLSIDLEYALITIERPWLLGDLFYTGDWWMVGKKKNAISTGLIEDQVADKAKTLLPMIPTQFLVIRNVRISAASSADWGSDGESITGIFNGSSSASGASGGGGVSLGFINFGGSHSESSTHSESAGGVFGDAHSGFGSTWDGQTLTINGAQIVAWLSEVVPACAPMDDPGLEH